MGGKAKGGKAKAAVKAKGRVPHGRGGVVAGKVKSKTKSKTKAPAKKRKSRAKVMDDKRDVSWLGSINDICAVFAVSRRSYLRRKDHPGYPKKTPKGYFVDDVRRFLESASLTASEGDVLDKDQEMAAKHRVQRQLAEIELQKSQGELMGREDHSRQITMLCQLFSNGLNDLVARLISVARDDVALVASIEACVDEVRSDLAESLEVEAERGDHHG